MGKNNKTIVSHRNINRIQNAYQIIQAMDREYVPKEFHAGLSDLEGQIRVMREDLVRASRQSPLTALTSPADYFDCPTGTRVAKKFGEGHWEKATSLGGQVWTDHQGTTVPHEHMAFASRDVLRWGGAE